MKIISISIVIFFGSIIPLSYVHELGHGYVCMMEGYDFDIQLGLDGGRMVCHGEIEKNFGEWNDDLIRNHKKKKIIEKAKTIYKVLDKNSNSSLVEMKPITGRKHQLRKQLFNIGHPIYGDDKYKLIDFRIRDFGSP